MIRLVVLAALAFCLSEADPSGVYGGYGHANLGYGSYGGYGYNAKAAPHK